MQANTVLVYDQATPRRAETHAPARPGDHEDKETRTNDYLYNHHDPETDDRPFVKS